MPSKAGQGIVRQGGARHCKARQGKAEEQGIARPGNAGQGIVRPDGAGHCEAGQGKALQGEAGQGSASKAGHCNAMQIIAKQGRAMHCNAGQGAARQGTGRSLQGRAGLKYNSKAL